MDSSPRRIDEQAVRDGDRTDDRGRNRDDHDW